LELAMSISFPGISGTTGFFTKPSSVASPSSSVAPSSSGLTLTGQSDQGNSTVQQFLEYAKMTPAQRIFADMLNQLGITEDQYKAMPPAEQQKVEQKVQQMIKDQVQNGGGKQTGMITDISA
jgi:hypothetical protein